MILTIIKIFIPPPPKCVEMLMEREKFNGVVLEPACGDGSMSKIIEKYNVCKSGDLIDRGFGSVGIDFLSDFYQVKGENIITNPPYKLAKEFLLKSLETANEKVAFFMRLSFLESKERYQIFKKYPPKIVYVLSARPEIYKNGIKTKNSGMVAYCWIVWDKTLNNKNTIIDWIYDKN